MCAEPTNDGLGAGERVRAPARELRVAAHRVLELGAVRLHGERRPVAAPTGPPSEDVVREDEVGREQLAQRRGVRLDVALALGRREVLERAARRSPS